MCRALLHRAHGQHVPGLAPVGGLYQAAGDAEGRRGPLSKAPATSSSGEGGGRGSCGQQTVGGGKLSGGVHSCCSSGPRMYHILDASHARLQSGVPTVTVMTTSRLGQVRVVPLFLLLAHTYVSYQFALHFTLEFWIRGSGQRPASLRTQVLDLQCLACYSSQ